MSNVIIEQPGRAPLADTPYDWRQNDVCFFAHRFALEAARHRARRTGRRQQVRQIRRVPERRNGPVLWAVQEIR